MQWALPYLPPSSGPTFLAILELLQHMIPSTELGLSCGIKADGLTDSFLSKYCPCHHLIKKIFLYPRKTPSLKMAFFLNAIFSVVMWI